MIKFKFITLFPELISNHFNYLPFRRAQKDKLASFETIDLKEFAIDKRGTVDDKPYGGGVGMLIRIEPIYKALKAIKATRKAKGKRVVLLSPKGKTFTQEYAKELAKCKEIILICGRYEGVDTRVEEYCTDIISIGNYVLSGGELPALVISESITRLIPGVLGKEEASKIESFYENKLEYPQYTRPENFKGKKVPKILLTGNHGKIAKWRMENEKEIGDFYSETGSDSTDSKGVSET